MKEFNDEVIFEIKYTWKDIIDNLPSKLKEKYSKLPDKRKKEIFDSSSRTISKCLESGLLSDIGTVMQAALETSDIYDEIEDYYLK